MNKYINNINEIIGSDTIDSHIISSMFSNIRNIIDNDRTKSKYELLYFFCDWSSHIDVDRSIFCRDLLDRLSDVWLDYQISLLSIKPDNLKDRLKFITSNINQEGIEELDEVLKESLKLVQSTMQEVDIAKEVEYLRYVRKSIK